MTERNRKAIVSKDGRSIVVIGKDGKIIWHAIK